MSYVRSIVERTYKEATDPVMCGGADICNEYHNATRAQRTAGRL